VVDILYGSYGLPLPVHLCSGVWTPVESNCVSACNSIATGSCRSHVVRIRGAASSMTYFPSPYAFRQSAYISGRDTLIPSPFTKNVFRDFYLERRCSPVSRVTIGSRPGVRAWCPLNRGCYGLTPLD